MKRNVIGTLMIVPLEQKKWLRKNYEFIKNEIEKTEFIDFQMIIKNIFGINTRLINYCSDNNGLIDDILDNYINQKNNTVFILDVFLCIITDCELLEYYELANNVKVIWENSHKAIEKYEEM